jgi:CHAT domain-containing protein
MFESTSWRAVLLAAIILIPLRAAALPCLREVPREDLLVTCPEQTGTDDNAELKLGLAVQRRIKGGETQSFTITLAAGQYAAIAVEQHGSILLATLRDPSGKDVLQTDMPAGGFGPIYLSHIASLSGDYRLEIRSVNSWAIEAPYDVSLTMLRSAEPADETVVTAQSLFSEGRKKERANDWDSAIKFYEQSLTYWNKLGDSHWQALTQYALSGAYSIRSHEGDAVRFEECLKTTLQILKTKMAVNDWRVMASALNDLGVFHGKSGNLNQAEEELNEALKLYAAHQDRRGQASALGNIANQYYRRGDLSIVRENLEKALALRRAENDKPGELNLLNSLASIYDRLGEPQQTLLLLTKVLERWREIPAAELRPADHEKISVVLNNIAAVSDKLGDWDRASSYYEEALGELGEQNPKNAATLDNLGEHYASLSNLVKARQLYEEALGLLPASSKPNPDIKAGILVHLGQLSIAEGNVTLALHNYDQALSLNPNPAKKVDVLTNQGAAFVLQGDLQKGLAAYEEAWKIQNSLKTEDRRAQASILQRRAEALALLGKPTEALSDLTQALDLWKAVKNEREEATTHNDIARLESKQRNLETALAHNEQAIGIIESLRSNISNRQLQTSYFEKYEDYYALNVELKMQLSEVNTSSEYVGLALESNEKARARVLLEALAEAGLRMDCKGSFDRNLAALVNERCSLQGRLTAKANARTQLLNGPHSAKQVELLDREIDEIVERYEGLEGRIRSQSRSFALLTKPEPLTWRQIQEQLDDDTLLLEYSLEDRHSYVWAVTPDSIDGFELPGGAQIEETAGLLNKALTANNREVKGETQSERNARHAKADVEAAEAAATLSKLILQPVSSLLGQKRLVIVADGALQLVPFVALPVPITSGPIRTENTAAHVSSVSALQIPPRLLVEDHEIITLPSASVLALQRREFMVRKKAPYAVAILANPVFEASDQRVRSASRSGARSSVSRYPSQQIGKTSQEGINDDVRASLTRALNDIGSGQLGWLPHSLDEARAIMKVAPPKQSMQVLDFKASRAMAMSPELSHYQFVHFATHGVVDLEHPELSGIVLSMVDEDGRPQDGFLRLHDIYNLNLPVEMVVLSACDTGVGKQVKGEGLIALTRGFMYAGSARVVASLWKVDDAATAELMGQFYKEIFTNGRRPAAALQAAQSSISKQKRWHSPYFWAGFVLQGEWR